MKEKLKFPLLTLALVFSLCVVSVVLSACGDGSGNITTTAAPTVTTTAPPVYKNPLTGLPGYDVTLLDHRPVMVVVNNLYVCRPQWGLTSPDIVLETVAEGGITRMMWLYADVSRIPDKVGSVRSARHYFIQIAQGYDAVFVHWGGSPYAKEAIRSGVIDDIDGMKGKYFDRDRSRGVAVEHTGYTTGEWIQKAIADKEFRTAVEDKYKNPLKFADAARALSGGVCRKVSLSFSDDFDYTYQYDAAKGLYYSYLNNKPFVGSDGDQQNFENVILIYTGITSLNDAKGRMTMDFSGGSGVYISNGTYENITWNKGGNTDLLKFYTAAGGELVLNPGRSYIGIIPTGRQSKTVISQEETTIG